MNWMVLLDVCVYGELFAIGALMAFWWWEEIH